MLIAFPVLEIFQFLIFFFNNSIPWKQNRNEAGQDKIYLKRALTVKTKELKQLQKRNGNSFRSQIFRNDFVLQKLQKYRIFISNWRGRKKPIISGSVYCYAYFLKLQDDFYSGFFLKRIFMDFSYPSVSFPRLLTATVFLVTIGLHFSKK